MILGIVGAIVFVVVVLPMLACGGCFVYARYKANQFVEEVAAEIEQEQQLEQQQNEVREQALLAVLADRLYPLAKVDIGLHWTEPEGVRRRRWADWTASKVSDGRYAVSGNLDIGTATAGTQSYRWKCVYTTGVRPTDSQANWNLETIHINDEQVFP